MDKHSSITRRRQVGVLLTLLVGLGAVGIRAGGSAEAAPYEDCPWGTEADCEFLPTSIVVPLTTIVIATTTTAPATTTSIAPSTSTSTTTTLATTTSIAPTTSTPATTIVPATTSTVPPSATTSSPPSSSTTTTTTEPPSATTSEVPGPDSTSTTPPPTTGLPSAPLPTSTTTPDTSTSPPTVAPTPPTDPAPQPGSDAPTRQVQPGDRFVIDGRSCAPGSQVVVTIDDAGEIANGVAAADGTFAVEVTVPLDLQPGTYLLATACPAVAGPQRQRPSPPVVAGGVVRQYLRIIVAAVPRTPAPAAPSTGAAGSTPASPSALPRTGAESRQVAQVGLALLLAGAACVALSRRRQGLTR